MNSKSLVFLQQYKLVLYKRSQIYSEMWQISDRNGASTAIGHVYNFTANYQAVEYCGGMPAWHSG